ncbi:sporulation inhibitor of replication protein SirA [Bacillus sp. NTK071]|uniref:sporulation inhibitor of replication protein SirA n=1 Tax=Bacillus sp. NTK071 TaxID=2802175 RepID=UPI001A8EFEC2|nr:sporulation inhibitor of replication protein SirA [Bacillus sp. NTK071]MBN8207549.1 sporulation inhibitor of replication protein SirA [Bacillus sp. NTK071]
MRHYEMYFIKQDVASQYAGKETLLYQLFLERKGALFVEEKSILDKQVTFITEPVCEEELNKYIVNELGGFRTYEFRNDGHRLSIKQSNSDASLFVRGEKLNLYSSGSNDAETVFFEVIRKLTPSFFAIDFQSGRYGWLNPVKQQKLV